MSNKLIHPYNFPDEIDKTLQALKILDLSKNTFGSISEQIDKNLGFIPFEGICLKKGTQVFRARKNPIFSKEMFGSLKELSIRDSDAITAFGRANIPKQAVFYCSLDPNTAAREVTQWHLDDFGALINKGLNLANYHPFTQFMTMSTWQLKRDLFFINTFKDEEVFGNEMSSDLTFDHLLFRYHLEKENFIRSKKMVVGFFNSEFSKTEIKGQYDYYFSAYYSNIVYTKSGLDAIAGLIYLSTAYELEGYNLAIPQKCLTDVEFVSADFCYTYNPKGRLGFEDQKIVISPSFRGNLLADETLTWTDLAIKS